MAEDTIQYLEDLGRRVVLAGHLMGAKIAMLVALRRPELVDKLVVIDNSPVNQTLDKQFTKDLVGMCHVERNHALREASHSSLSNQIDRILFEYEKSPMVRMFLASNVIRRSSKHDKSPIKFRVPVLNFLKDGTISEMGGWPDQYVTGRKFGGPVIVMRSTKSGFVDDISVFERYFDDFEVKDFDTGHWLVSEQPDEFVERMNEFVERS